MRADCRRTWRGLAGAPGTVEPFDRIGEMNDRREPVPNVTVALIPDGALRQRKDLYRTTTTDISGRFRVQGLPMAAYKAFAFEEVPLGAWQNPDFMRPLESRGAAVEISSSDAVTADLQVIPAPRR